MSTEEESKRLTHIEIFPHDRERTLQQPPGTLKPLGTTPTPERRRSYEEVQRSLGREVPKGPVRVERRDYQVRRGIFGKPKRMYHEGKRPKVRRAPDIGPLYSRFRTYEGGGAQVQGFKVYPVKTIGGERKMRVSFNGRQLAPVFSTTDEAMQYVNEFKEFAGAEYAARKQGMVAADSKFIRESLVKSRTSPFFVPTVIDSGARRLTA